MRISLPQLAPMQCDKGCGACCGIVPCSLDELNAIRGVVKARGIKPIKQGATCPLYINGECSVYTARPAICRLFGHVDSEALKCTRGYSATISKDDLGMYHEHFKRSGKDLRYTHEVCFTRDEVGEILHNYVNMKEAQR